MYIEATGPKEVRRATREEQKKTLHSPRRRGCPGPRASCEPRRGPHCTIKKNQRHTQKKTTANTQHEQHKRNPSLSVPRISRTKEEHGYNSCLQTANLKKKKVEIRWRHRHFPHISSSPTKHHNHHRHLPTIAGLREVLRGIPMLHMLRSKCASLSSLTGRERQATRW